MGCVPSILRHLLAYLWAQLVRQPWLSLQVWWGGLLGNTIMPVEGTASLNLASLPVPFLSAVHICMDTHLLPAGEETAKGQCPHSIQHLQYLPGVIRPLLLWCAHQPPVLSDSGPEGLCCRMPVDAPTDSDQDKTSTAPPPLLSAGPV